jgi:hypothetical protein
MNETARLPSDFFLSSLQLGGSLYFIEEGLSATILGGDYRFGGSNKSFDLLL